MTVPVSLLQRYEHGRAWPVLTARFPPGWRAIASAVVGGGTGPCEWWLNSMVARDYDRYDPDRHVHEIAAALDLPADRPGVGMLTAADVSAVTSATDGGVGAWATVGLGWPVWAAATDRQAAAEHDLREPGPPRVGTINLLLTIPVPLGDAALVNAVVTATEAKTQALVEAGIAGTGTSSDAVCIACPTADADHPAEPFAGPRSVWGSRLARAVHAAVAQGTAQWVARNGRPAGDTAGDAAGDTAGDVGPSA